MDVDLFPLNIGNKEIGFKIKSSFRLIDATAINSASLTASDVIRGDSMVLEDENLHKSASSDISLKNVSENQEARLNRVVSIDDGKYEGRKPNVVLHEPKLDAVVGETDSNEYSYEEEIDSNEDSYEDETSSNEDSYEEGTSEFAKGEKSMPEYDGNRSQDTKQSSFRMMSGNNDEVLGWYFSISYKLR